MTRTLQALVAVYVVRLVARGTDLITGDLAVEASCDSLYSTSVVWGVAALIAAVMLAVSLLLQHARLLVVSCLTAFAVYFMYGLAAFDAVTSSYPPDHWRLVTDHWCAALVMLILAVSISFRHDITKMLKAKGVEHGVG